jgi:hypothetical protein
MVAVPVRDVEAVRLLAVWRAVVAVLVVRVLMEAVEAFKVEVVRVLPVRVE